YLDIKNQPLRDLSMLKGAPISMLILDNCPFTDLTPIHDLKLETFYLLSNSVSDLSPLRGMPLKTLLLGGSKFNDVSPLAGMPLKGLFLDECPNLTDVAALAEIPTLENVTVPLYVHNVEALRGLGALRRLGFTRTGWPPVPDTTVAEFWKDSRPDSWISKL